MFFFYFKTECVCKYIYINTYVMNTYVNVYRYYMKYV